MKSYEGIFIVKPEAEKEELNRLAALAQEIITKQGGKVVQMDLWGRRPLGHRIRGQMEGQYIYVSFDMDPLKVVHLERAIKLQEEILKALVTRLE
ncbi:MAG: 30S ribosomal protein S6, partial [Candidatus Omnitrophica bacterium]|nr:30S ribosomal protein S6 [Candidatus Omnitrophota bacterium]